MLFSILQEELAAIQGSSTSGQRQLIQQEVQVRTSDWHVNSDDAGI